MINVTISAKAGILAFPHAKGFLVEDIVDGTSIVANAGVFSRIISGCDDVNSRPFKQENIARAEARAQWAADRSLAMFLMLLETDSSEEEIVELATSAEALLKENPEALPYLEYRLFARPFPHPVPYERLKELLCKSPILSDLLSRVLDLQPSINQVFDAFNAIPKALFEGEQLNFERAAVQRGMFRAMALAANSDKPAESTIFELMRTLGDQNNYRAIVQSWTEILKRSEKVVRDWASLREAPAPPAQRDFARAGGRRAYESAIAQQQSIIDRLRAGDEDRARAFAVEMVDAQIKSSEPEHIAKSLTNISTKAREMHAFALSLEWAQKATEIKPDDPRAWGHLAEGLVHFGRFAEALQAVERGELFGENLFFATLRARILRMQHQLTAAMEAYEQAIEISKGTSEEPFNVCGKAEVLRDLGRLDEATAVYRTAKSLFPYHEATRNGYAATLAEAGKLEESLAEYSSILNEMPNVVAKSGKASVLRVLGHPEQAIEIFESVLENSPFNVVGRCGLAECYFDLDQKEEALRVSEEAYFRFPESVDAAQLYGNALSRSGEKDRALDILKSAIERFPFAPSLISSMARTEWKSGRYEEALRLYDLGLSKFPSEWEMQNGRASMLRRLGRLDEALEIYDEILSRNKNVRFALNAKASIEIYRRNFRDAFFLLSVDNPQTEDEWKSYLLLSHLDWRTGYTDHAIKRLQWSIENCKYKRAINIFKATLASMMLVKGNDKEAARVELSSVNDYTALIAMHILVVSGNTGEAKAVYDAMNDNFLPPQYFDVARDIAIIGGIERGGRKFSDSDLILRESAILLLEAA